jgi:serine/threonine-protein kinase
LHPHHPLIGRVLQNRFRVASFVTEGGMAQIFCGTDMHTARPVAIKLVQPELSQNRQIVGRFVREVQVAARLEHPNIVRTLAIGDDPGLLYMVMEFLFGEDLSAPIKQRGTFSEARAAQIVIDVCDALHHAHQHGVIHRDIKPENVMLCRQPDAPQEEVVKVLDFGIAKVLDATPDALLMDEDPTGVRSVLTRVGACVGTPAYMSPEQSGSSGAVDARSDIYSVGVLLYELVCGCQPFVGETPLQVVARHIHDAPQPPSVHTPIHPGLEQLILQALAKRQDDRPQSARQLADGLRRLYPELSPLGGSATAPPERWASRTLRRTPAPAAFEPRAPSNSVPPSSHVPASGHAAGPPRVSITQPSAHAPPASAPVAQPLPVAQTLPVAHTPPVAQTPPAAQTLPIRPAPFDSVRPPMSVHPMAVQPQENLPPSDLDARIDRLLRLVNVLAILLGLAFIAIMALVVIIVVRRG